MKTNCHSLSCYSVISFKVKHFQSQKFDFDETNGDLLKCLFKKDITIEDFKKHLNGTWVKPAEEDEGIFDKASALELIQPDSYESPTSRGYLKIK